MAAVIVLAAGSAEADWIVDTEGNQIETLGAWSIEGRLVVFELPGGKLVSMPLSEVDLAASSKATHASQESLPSPAAEQPSPPPKAVMVITDDDVAHAEPGQSVVERLDSTPTTDTGTDGEAMPEPAPSNGDGRLEVKSWDHTLDTNIDGVLVTGLIANTSLEVAAEIELTVRFLDHEENLLGTAPAALTSTTLLPEQTARFRVEAAGIYAFTSARFDVASLGLEIGETPDEGD